MKKFVSWLANPKIQTKDFESWCRRRFNSVLGFKTCTTSGWRADRVRLDISAPNRRRWRRRQWKSSAPPPTHTSTKRLFSRSWQCRLWSTKVTFSTTPSESPPWPLTLGNTYLRINLLIITLKEHIKTSYSTGGWNHVASSDTRLFYSKSRIIESICCFFHFLPESVQQSHSRISFGVATFLEIKLKFVISFSRNFL